MISRIKSRFIFQVNRLNARFPFVSSGVKGHLLQNLLLFLLWVPDLGFIWETCQSAKCRMEQGRAENFKSAMQHSSAVATFDSQWKSFQKSALQPSSQMCKRIFSTETTYVSFIGVKAKTRVTGSLGRSWARLVAMDGLVPLDPQDEHTSAHAGMIK